MTRSFHAKLLILAVFVVGVLTGGVATDLYRTRVPSGDRIVGPGRAGQRIRPPDFQDFEDFLDLSPGQQEQLDAILAASRERYRDLQSRTRPMYRELTVQSQEEIRAILDPAQLERYEEWIENLVERRGPGRGRIDRDRETP